jgi:hypothetical protein
MKRDGVAYSVLFVFLIMFVLSFLEDLIVPGFFYSLGIGAIVNIIMAIFSSFIGLFLVWRNFLKIQYQNSRLKEALLALITALVFTLFSFVYGNMITSGALLRYYELTAIATAETFLTCLTGFLIGFLLGGIRLRRMTPPISPPPSTPSTFSTTAPEQKPPARARTGKMLVMFLLLGAVVGFFMGYVVWIVFGQIQLAAGIDYPYAALLPPPTYYLLAWTGFGALGFVFEMPSLLKS